MAESSVHHRLLMGLTIIINLCLSSNAQFPPLSQPTTTTPPPIPSVPAIIAPPPLPSLPIVTPPPIPSLPNTTQPPIPSLPTTTQPPIPSLPTTTLPPPPIPSIPTTVAPPPPLPPVPTIAPPLPPPPPTIQPISPPPPPPPTIPPISSPPAPISPIPTTLPPPPLPETAAESDARDEQIDRIIDALINGGDFGAWAGLLSAADLSGIPIAATLFIPGNDALSHFPTASTTALNFDPFLIPYHIVPQRLSFADLQRFKTHTRLPTLLPARTLLITDNSPFNFSINDVPITQPDLYATTTVSVHGIKTLLDYSDHGGDGLFLPDDPTSSRSTPPQATAPPFFEAGEIMGSRRSDAACLCSEFPIVFSVFCTALAFKFHRNPLCR